MDLPRTSKSLKNKVILLLMISWSTTIRATAVVSQSENGAQLIDMQSAMQALRTTLTDITYNFVGHTPYIIAGLAVLLFTWGMSYVVSKLVYNMSGHSKMRGSLKDLLQRLSSILVWVLGLLLAAMVIFPGLTPAKALGGLGLASVAIGFAFKEIFENFFAGIMLLWKYPFEKGDFIECESIMGKVEDISVRMTQIRRPDGELVLTPNSFLFKNPVRVLTDLNFRRMTIMTGVAYSEDADKSVEIVEKALSSCNTVNQKLPIEVFLNGFGDSSIDIEVSWWTDPTPLGQRKSRSEVVGAIKRALDEAGIEIPFPYRTMTFKEPLVINQVKDSSVAD